MHLQVKKKKKTLKVDLFATPDKSFFGSYHHPLGRDKLLIARSYGGRLRKPISKCITLSQLKHLQLCTFSRHF